MTQETSRFAAVNTAITQIQGGTTIGLGSGRAVFALAEAIGSKWDGQPPVKAIVASELTRQYATKAGIQVIDLDANTRLDVVFDGADEIDPDFNLIKGGGASLLQEKMVFAVSDRVVIMAEESKRSSKLGDTRLLPVEVVRFGWEATQQRILSFVDSSQRRLDDTGKPVITDEGHFLLDVKIPDIDLHELATKLKLTLGVVEHGLFLGFTNELIIGHPDGTATTLTNPDFC